MDARPPVHVAKVKGVVRERLLPMAAVVVVFLVLTLVLAAGCGRQVDTLGRVEGELFAADVLDFGEVQIGLASVRELELENRGNGVVAIQAFERGAFFQGDDYSFEIDETSVAIAPGKKRPIAVQFFASRAHEERIETTLRMVIEDPTSGSSEGKTFTVTLRAQPVSSGLRVEPEVVDFGAVLEGASKWVDVRVTNELSVPTGVFTRLDSRGGADLRSISGAGRFELTTPFDRDTGSLLPEGELLAPNASLTVRLGFLAEVGPSEGVVDQGEWTIANCAYGPCERRVDLEATSVRLALVCTPDRIDFGAVSPGIRASRTVECKNISNHAITILRSALSVDGDAEFELEVGDPDRTSLDAGESIAMRVWFVPSEATIGQHPESKLEVLARNHLIGRDIGPVLIPLAGRVGGPEIAVAPRALSFGRVAIGTRARRRLLIQNTGFDELVVTDIQVDTATTGVFSGRGTALALVPGQSEIVEVTFEPNETGRVVSAVVITSNDQDEPKIVVPVTGEGISLPPCAYRIAPSELNFGIVQVLRATTQAFRVENIGHDDCLLNNLEIVPGSSSAFSLFDGEVQSTIIAPQEAITVLVEYRPYKADADDGGVSFYISDPENSAPTVPLVGAGSDSALLITPNEVDFGKVGVACAPHERSITIYNTGAGSTTIDRIVVAPSVTPEFRLHDLPPGLPAPPGVGAAVVPGQSLTFSVSYEAAQAGVDAGTFQVWERGQTQPYVIPLLGEGAPDPVNEDVFTQLESPLVDILFVIDNSCSMQEEQVSLTENFSSFMRFAEAHRLDYQIAVVSTDVDGSFSAACPQPLVAERPGRQAMGACGYFADGTGAGVASPSSDPNWRIIAPDEYPSPDVAFNAVATQGIAGSGSEKGLQAAYQALSSPLITGWNGGFLRPEAYLALIFVSDEEDQSTNPVDFYVNYFRAIKGVRNANRFSASAIVGPVDDPFCASTADPGRRYVELARETGGVHDSICTKNWAASLENLGQSAFGYKTSFFLSNEPLVASIEVSLDGRVIDETAQSGQKRWSYEPDLNAIRFEPLAIPEPGSRIAIRYRAECR
ncbi:MAG: choice-of-anchor D domain-containing protein [Deltaproteobacteria bacterium]|nr:choice-of-anchor D domain-containing protein [Deltaproteobacteria bacterium]